MIKTSNKRILSVLLTLALMISTVSGLTFSATAAPLGLSEYELFLEAEEGGTVTLGQSTAMGLSGVYSLGQSVAIKANPDADYDFDGWVVTDGAVADANAASTTFTLGASNDEQAVTVTAQFVKKPIAVTGVSLDKTSDTVEVGKSVTLNATVAPSDAVDKAVTWSSSNNNIASVNNGVVTGRAAGTATITVKTNDGNFTANAIITVTEPETGVKVTGVQLEHSSYGIAKGLRYQLKATVYPTNATNKNVTWSSSDSSIVSVDNDGWITAVEVGTADITVKTVDGGHTATTRVTVDQGEGGYHTLTVVSGTGGYIASDVSGDYEMGDVVTISAVANTGYRFSHWTTSNGGKFDNSNAATTTFTMPGSDTSVTAYFTRNYTGDSGLPAGTTTSGGGGGSSSRGGGSRTTTDWTAGTTAVGTVTRSSNVDANGTVSSSAIKADLDKAISAATGDTAVISARNATTISASTVKTLADTAAAANKAVVLRADTMSANGASVQGRLYVEPAKLSSMTGDLKLGVYTDSANTAATKAVFSNYFSNTVSVIHCEQKGGFGAKLKIAAKVDLSGLDKDNLVFYSYDRSTNSYTLIEDAEYFIDENGFLHFFTEYGDEIIVTDSALARK